MSATSGLSYYAINKALDFWYNKVAWTPGTSRYIALCTANPTQSGTGAACNEHANSAGYARTAATFTSTVGRQQKNLAAVTFPTATSDWSAITHWAVLDSGTYGAGNLLAFGEFSAPFTLASGSTAVITAGTLSVTMSAGVGVGISSMLANRIMNQIFIGTTYTTFDNVKMGLSHTVVDDDDTYPADWTEVTGTGYAKVAINPNSGASPKWSLAASGAITNDSAVVHDNSAGGDWTQIVAAVLLGDSGEGVYWIMHYDNTNIEDQTPTAGQPIQFLTGAVDVSIN